jgi:hypothetical protein
MQPETKGGARINLKQGLKPKEPAKKKVDRVLCFAFAFLFASMK